MEWTPEVVQQLIKLWAAGISASQIGRQLGFTRNAVIGKAHRMGLRGRKKVDGVIVQEEVLPTRSAPARQGQAEFRLKVLAAYRNQCCITGNTQSETLEAAHIVPWSMTQTQRVQNGLSLRKDIHALFDCGLISVSTGYRVIISPRLTDRLYTALSGRLISLPTEKVLYPEPRFIEWHNRKVFKSAEETQETEEAS